MSQVQGETIKVKSPLSNVIIIEYDPATKKTIRRVCDKCRNAVVGRRLSVRRCGPYLERGVGDTLYFLGSGLKYRTLVVPHYGRVAYLKREDIEQFLRRFGRNEKRNWVELTGTPFPYKLFK